MKLRLIFVYSLVLSSFSFAVEFQWDEDSSGQPSIEKRENPIQSSPPPPHPWSPQTPVPAPQRPLPPAQWDRSDPFYHMHQRMEEMNRRMDEVFSQFFQGFPSGPKLMNPNSVFDQFQKRFSHPSMGTPLTPPQTEGFLKVEEKKDYVVVEMPVQNPRIDAFKVEVHGQVLRIEQKIEAKEEKREDHGFQSFSSLSTSVQSALLPAPVEPKFTKSILKGKLVLVFKKSR